MVRVAGKQTEETRAAQSCHEFLEAFAIRIILSVSVIANALRLCMLRLQANHTPLGKWHACFI